MQERPKIKLQLTKLDKFVEVIGWCLLLSMWALALISYRTLPEIIPVHYDISGKADGFGEKWTIITLPIVASILFIGLTILNQFPHIFNYTVEITPENASKQYTYATRLLRIIKLSIVIIFDLILYHTISYSDETSDLSGIWFFPLVILLIIVPNIYFLVKSSR